MPMTRLSESALDRIFFALSDPTRRAMLTRLADVDRSTLSDLAAPFRMTLPAAMKHVRALADAGLITRAKQGRVVVCALAPGATETAEQWLRDHRQFWTQSFERLAEVVESRTGNRQH